MIKNYAFTRSPTVTLLTSTTYWVVAVGDAYWVSIRSTSEDETPAMGWEIGDAYESRPVTLGAEFVRDVEGECVVEDFPMLGETVTLEWQQNSQNFVITDVE